MKRFLRVMLVLGGLAVAAVVGLVWFGPVAVGDKKVLLDFLLGRGIEPPTATQAVSQLLRVSGSRCTRPRCRWRAGRW
jgi:hypothetical protein